MATKRFIKLSVVTVIAAAVLVLNPVFGLLGGGDDDDDGFQYGAQELRIAVEGTWQLTFAWADAPSRTITFTLAQGAEAQQTHATRTLVRSAAACATRSLVKSAGACVDTTFMLLDVVLVADGRPQPQPQPEQAMFLVEGARFTVGELHATIGDARVRATVTARGAVASASASIADPAGGLGSKVNATLVRARR